MAIQKNTKSLLIKLGLPFTAVINSTMDLIKDPASLGIYVYLQSKPENWVIREKDLMARFGKGRDFIRSRLKELRDVGLLVSKSRRSESGKIIGWTTILYSHIESQIKTKEEYEDNKSVEIEENEILEDEKPQKKEAKEPEQPLVQEKEKTTILENPTYINNINTSLEKKETTTTKQNVVVVSETIDHEIIDLRNQYMPSDEREIEEFVKQCKWHLEKGDAAKYNFSQRFAGLKKLIKQKRFETPATYPKKKNVIQNFITNGDNSLLQDYKSWLNSHSKRVSIESWFPDALKRTRAIELYAKEQNYLQQKNG